MKRRIYEYNGYWFSTYDDAHDYMVYVLEYMDLVYIGPGETIYSIPEYREELKEIKEIEVEERVTRDNYRTAMDLSALVETLKIEFFVTNDSNDLKGILDDINELVDRHFK